jgi:3-isopropylmalate/(R)-2-methylmalate dehydratase small subunit
MPEVFESLTGAAAPLLRPNIDTDTIAPGSRPGGGPAPVRAGSGVLAGELFAGWRYDAAGNEDPHFVLNRREFRAANILLAGPNFGCGSSREAAVWMLKEWGFRCIVAPSFGEIFYGSCFKNGVLPVQLEEAVIERLAEEAAPGAPAALFEVELNRNRIRTPSGKYVGFELPRILREALLSGLDEIDQTLGRAAAIARFEAEAAAARPWLYGKRA